MLEKLTVIIPSRTHDKQTKFLIKATDSIFKQNIIKKFDLTILVAIDKGSSVKYVGLEIKRFTNNGCMHSNNTECTS